MKNSHMVLAGVALLLLASKSKAQAAISQSAGIAASSTTDYFKGTAWDRIFGGELRLQDGAIANQMTVYGVGNSYGNTWDGSLYPPMNDAAVLEGADFIGRALK